MKRWINQWYCAFRINSSQDVNIKLNTNLLLSRDLERLLFLLYLSRLPERDRSRPILCSLQSFPRSPRNNSISVTKYKYGATQTKPAEHFWTPGAVKSP